MKTQLIKIAGLASYLIILCALFNFNWILILNPKPFFSVLLGMLILTASQYKKTYTKDDIIYSLRWNLIFSSFLTTLISILSSISTMKLSDTGRLDITESILPMLYGSILYLILNILFNNPIKVASKENSSESAVKSVNLFEPALSQRIFIEYGLTNRECHVASKLLENASNKEIAAQLYVSEATIKKHIQNIYQKFGATDRSSYKEIYIKEASKVVHTIS